MKSLYVIKMFSQLFIGYIKFGLETFSNNGLNFLMLLLKSTAGLSCFPEFILHHFFSLSVSPTPTHRTKIFIDVPVDVAELKLSAGMSNGRSSQTRGFYSSRF